MANRVRPAVAGDCAYIAERLRDEDLAEVDAGGDGREPLDHLIQGFALSEQPMTVEIDGLPAGMVGVHLIEPGVGALWYLGTDAILAHRVWFLRASREWIVNLSTGRCDRLYTACDERYRAAIDWLHWLGFERIGRVAGMPPGAMPFARMVCEVSKLGHGRSRTTRHRGHGSGGQGDAGHPAAAAEAAQAP